MTELEEVDGGGSGGGGGEAAALLALEGEPPTPLSTKAPLSEGSGERERGGERAMQVREAPPRPDGEHKQYGLTDYTQYDFHVTWQNS